MRQVYEYALYRAPVLYSALAALFFVFWLSGGNVRTIWYAAAAAIMAPVAYLYKRHKTR